MQARYIYERLADLLLRPTWVGRNGTRERVREMTDFSLRRRERDLRMLLEAEVDWTPNVRMLGAARWRRRLQREMKRRRTPQPLS